ncbi:MAG: Fic family protein [Nanoarchaeota archaeon]
MNYIPKFLANELRRKMDLVRNPSVPEIIFKADIWDICSLFCQRRTRKSIETNAQIHSYRIEHPETIVPYSVPRTKRNIKRGIKDIRSAFEWGIKNFGPDGFNVIGEAFIKELAGWILYEREGGAPYRNTGVTITGSRTTPPYPEKVITKEMPEFVDNLKRQFDLNADSSDIIHKLETSIYAHFHLARIHPFIDGNGRTSRLLQDILLTYYNIPVPIIEAGERGTYYECLDRAVYDWKDRKGLGKSGASEGEQSFYKFMAGKINVSLDKLLNCIH